MVKSTDDQVAQEQFKYLAKQERDFLSEEVKASRVLLFGMIWIKFFFFSKTTFISPSTRSKGDKEDELR
jgi:hypothetical protein